jgi:ComF family protein
MMLFKKYTGFILELLFPKFCFGCHREGSYLCEDCQATLETFKFHKQHSGRYLKDLYFTLPYRGSLIRNLIQKFKHQPLVKELAKPLSSLIIEHLQLLDNKPSFTDFVIIPIPLEKKRLKARGFNQAEEIAKELASFFEIPLISDCLMKIKETPPQAELAVEARKENIKGVLSVKNGQEIKNKKILLIDDIYVTGSTMEEAARTLKKAGAKEVIGIAVVRADPDKDCF